MQRLDRFTKEELAYLNGGKYVGGIHRQIVSLLAPHQGKIVTVTVANAGYKDELVTATLVGGTKLTLSSTDGIWACKGEKK